MEFVTHDLDGEAGGAMALVVGGCMCGRWIGGGGMGCRRWLGCGGGVGVVGQGGSEDIVQV